jgi:hypothetical protein
LARGSQLKRQSLGRIHPDCERQQDLEYSRELVERLVQRLFSGVPGATVLELLDQYGTESYERERDRVQTAILKLSGGDLKRLAEMVALAKTDYRDALAAAEYPLEFRASGRFETPAAEMDRIRQEDRRQYLDWLREHSA